MARRAERVAEAIRREASLLLHDELRDPRVGFITVTKVDVSDDLRNACVYYSILGNDKDRKRAKAGLKSAMPFIRAEIGHRLELRYVPEIILREDDTLTQVAKIEEVFQKINEEKEVQGPVAGDETANDEEDVDDENTEEDK